MNLNYTELQTLRTSAILTNSYVAGTVWGPQGGSTVSDPVENNQLLLLIDFTKGSLDSMQLKIEFSENGTDYYQETSSAVSSGTSTETVLAHSFGATGKFRLPIPIVDRYIKVSVKGTGTVTSSLVKVLAILAIRY